FGIFDDTAGSGIGGAPAFRTEPVAMRPIGDVHFRRPLLGRANRDEDPATVPRCACHVAPPVLIVHRFPPPSLRKEVSPRHRTRSTQTLHGPGLFPWLAVFAPAARPGERPCDDQSLKWRPSVTSATWPARMAKS